MLLGVMLEELSPKCFISISGQGVIIEKYEVLNSSGAYTFTKIYSDILDIEESFVVEFSPK